jgi:hypothetical protein
MHPAFLHAFIKRSQQLMTAAVSDIPECIKPAISPVKKLPDAVPTPKGETLDNSTPIPSQPK